MCTYICREIKEETDLDINDPKVIAVTNNLETYRQVSCYLKGVFYEKNIVD
jgi:hypothetical protein